MVARAGFVLALLTLVLAPTSAFAHKIGVEAKLKDGTVRVEVFYDDDTAAEKAAVTVTDGDGKEIAQGKSDSAGVWSFPVPKAGKYKVAVDAGAGHLAKTTITIPPAEALAPGTAEATHPTPADVVISDGPTRAETTGPMRWLMAAVGVAVIAGLTVGARYLVRRNTVQPPETP